MKISEKVIHNTVFSSLGYVWWILISLFLTPYIIAKVGIQGYGLFVVIEAALGYVSSLDITGINVSLVKFVSEYHAAKEFGSLHRLLRQGFVYDFLFYGAAGCAIWSLRSRFLGLLHIEAAFLPAAEAVLGGFLAIMFIKGVFGVFKTVLFGLQRMDVENIVLVTAVTLNACFTVFFLERGDGLPGLVLAGFLMVCLAACLRVVCVARLLPPLPRGAGFWDLRLFRTAFAYGIKMQVIAFSELINKGVDKVLLGVLAGVSFSGLYEIGAKVANVTNLFPALFLPSVLPAASELQVVQDRRRLQDLYVRGTKYLMMLLAPVCVFAVLHAGLIIRAWMGFMARPESVLAVQFLTLAYGAYLVSSVGRYMARGMGALGFELSGSTALTALNIVLSVVLIKKIGFAGALWGTSVAALTGSAWFLMRFHRFLGFPIRRLMTKSVLGPVAVSAFVGLLLRFLPAFPPAAAGRLVLIGDLFMRLAVFAIAYIAGVLRLGFVDAYEREIFIGALRSLKDRWR